MADLEAVRKWAKPSILKDLEISEVWPTAYRLSDFYSSKSFRNVRSVTTSLVFLNGEIEVQKA